MFVIENATHQCFKVDKGTVTFAECVSNGCDIEEHRTVGHSYKTELTFILWIWIVFEIEWWIIS